MWASIVRMLANRVIRLRAIRWDKRFTENDKATIIQINNSAPRLATRRAVEINVSEPFARSKIAWKLAVYQHALLYRVVALTNGTAIAWNYRASLSAFLAARALMETMAAMAGFEHRVANLLAAEDLGELDALAMRATYASRDPDWLTDFPESKAVNVQTYIQQYDKRVLPGF